MTTFIFIPDPRGMIWKDWVSALVGYNPTLRSMVDPRASWQDFGQRLTLIDVNTPRPDFFESWEAWANALRRGLGV